MSGLGCKQCSSDLFLCYESVSLMHVHKWRQLGPVPNLDSHRNKSSDSNTICVIPTLDAASLVGCGIG